MNPRTAFADALLARQIARRYIAKMGMEHDSPEALKDYLKEHPGADKSKHHVKKDNGKGKERDVELDLELMLEADPSLDPELALENYLEKHPDAEPPKNWPPKGKGEGSKAKAPESKSVTKVSPEAAKALSDAGGKIKKMLDTDESASKYIDTQTDAIHAVTDAIWSLPDDHPDRKELSKTLKELKDQTREKQPDGKKVKEHFKSIQKLLDKAQASGEGKSEAKKPAKKRVKAVRDIMEKRKLKDEDADELEDFVKRKPAKGQKLSDFQLMLKFLREASPETKKRMKDMSISEFKAMYNSIMDEEGEGTAKSAARRVLARYLTAADYKEYVERKKQEGGKPLSRDEWEARTQGGKDEPKKGEKDEGKEQDEGEEKGGGKDWEPKSMSFGQMPSKKDFEEHIRSGKDEDGDPLWDDDKGYSLRLRGRDEDVASKLDLDSDTNLESPEEVYDYIEKVKDFSEHDDEWYTEEHGIDPDEVEEYREAAMGLASSMMQTLGYEWT